VLTVTLEPVNGATIVGCLAEQGRGENLQTNGIHPSNHDHAKSPASLDRFKKISINLKARTIIQHEKGTSPSCRNFSSSQSNPVFIVKVLLKEYPA